MSVNVGSAIAYLDLDISKFKSGIGTAKSALDDFVNSSDGFSSRLNNFGSALSGVGVGMTATLTTSIVGVGTAATKVAGDFDASMSKVQAISGATADEMERLRDKAIEMGAKTKFSAKESADAFTYMAMAGWDAEQMIAGIGGIMSLAAADGLDLATTSDIVTDALTAFGLQASDSAHFADVLAQASSSANTNVSMLGESFKYIAPVAGSLGMSVEDTAIALGLMANSGIKGSQAGTSLRASLTNLVKPTDQMASKMEELGIEVTNSDGTMKSLREIIDILRDRFKSLTQAEQASTAATLFGKEAMSGMLAIINTSEADYNKLADAIYGASGRADEMAETMMDNLPGAIEQLKGAVESLAIKIGEALVPTIQSITEFITRLVEKLNTLSDEQIEQIVQIGAVVAAIGPVLIVVGKVISVVSTVISVGGKLVAGIKTLVTFISGVLIPAIGSISAPVLAVIAVVLALVAAGVALYKNWEEVSAWAKKAWGSITETIKEAIDSIGKFFADLGAGVQKVIDNIGNWLSNLWESISGFFENLFSNIGTWFENITTTIGDFFTTLTEKVTTAIDLIWGKIVEWGTNLVEKGREIASTFVENFVGFFTNLAERVSGFVNEVLSMISSWGSSLLSKAREIGSGFTSAITSGLEKVGSFFADIFTDIIDSITNLGPKVFETGKNIIMKLWEGMKNIFTSVVDWIENAISELFRPISSRLESMINSVKGTFSNIGSSIKGFFSGSHANGLDYVPYNGYIAQLHQGERVLTKEENEQYSNRGNSGGGDTYIFNSPEPIDEYEAARLMKQTKQEMDMDI